MVDAYKVLIFSGDYSTFIRPYMFYIPRTNENTKGDIGSRTIHYEDALSCVNAFNNDYFVAFDVKQTVFAIHSEGASMMANAGWEHCLIMDGLFDNNLTAGNSRILQFGNKSYIKITITTYVGPSYEQLGLTLQFYLKDGTLVATTTMSVNNNDYGSWRNTTGIITLPFVYRNLNGIISNTHLRRYSAIGCGISYKTDMSLVTWGNWGIYTTGGINWLEELADIGAWVQGLAPIDPDNPYSPGGPSGPGDDTPGNFSDDSDDVEEDTLPTISAVGTGMATIFTPGSLQLKNLSDIFWGASWWQALQNSVEGIDKMFVSLGIVPFVVTPGATVEVTWLGLAWTEVYLTLAAQQYFEFDMGSINLADDPRIFTSNSALDYSPFSKLGIYLPFIGYQELDVDEFRNATVSLKYRIDILSGTCVALVKINGNTIYQFTGNCMTQIPITSQSFESMITNAVNVGIAVSGVRSASAVGSAATEVNSELNAAGKTSEAQKTLADTKSRAHVEGATDRLLSACANSIMGLKPNYDKSGAVSNSASLLAVKQPFLFLTTPRQCIPEHYQRYSGFPSNITRKISECSGFLVVESIRLNHLVATSKEVEEIYDLLKSGVIV